MSGAWNTLYIQRRLGCKVSRIDLVQRATLCAVCHEAVLRCTLAKTLVMKFKQQQRSPSQICEHHLLKIVSMTGAAEVHPQASMTACMHVDSSGKISSKIDMKEDTFEICHSNPKQARKVAFFHQKAPMQANAIKMIIMPLDTRIQQQRWPMRRCLLQSVSLHTLRQCTILFAWSAFTSP